MPSTSTVPKPVWAAARAALEERGGVGGARRRTFRHRLERWWPDLLDGVTLVHPDPEQALEVATRLVEVAAHGFADRPRELRDLDERRLLRPDWLQQPGMFGYAGYAERLAPGGTLTGPGGVVDRLDHLERLGVTYLHLMPLLQPRDGDSDGGYAVADFDAVRSDLGTTDDLRDLATALRERGVSLVVDLVLNHVAREHRWAVRARRGKKRYQAYFHLFPEREGRDGRPGPDDYERTLPEVFPDFAPGSFSHDPELFDGAGGWAWTTFHDFQWDLNWANPDVLVEFAGIVCRLANLGVEVLRLDAIAFLWKRIGTDCQNQPEVHALVQALRAVARIAAPAVAFKAEAIVGPRELVPYLGAGRHTGRVSELAYHNSLMVQIWSMLAAGDVVLARQALAALPPAPPSGTWITYLRCHDDIGWAIDDGDAAAVGVTGPGHRGFLADFYSGVFPGSWADGLVFQHNEATGDRRISGTAASLAGVHGPDGAAPEADNAGLARLFLGHAIAVGWGGVPVVWSGDELGLPNDPDWDTEPGHEADNRWAHRPRLPADLDAATAPGSTAARVLDGVAHLARVRASLPELHAAASVQVLPDTDDGVLAVVRRHAAGTMVGLYNVTATPRPFPVGWLRALGLAAPHEALADHPVAPGEDGQAWLPPYAAWWVVDRP